MIKEVEELTIDKQCSITLADQEIVFRTIKKSNIIAIEVLEGETVQTTYLSLKEFYFFLQAARIFAKDAFNIHNTELTVEKFFNV